MCRVPFLHHWAIVPYPPHMCLRKRPEPWHVSCSSKDGTHFRNQALVTHSMRHPKKIVPQVFCLVLSIFCLNVLRWKCMWKKVAWDPGEMLPVRVGNTDLDGPEVWFSRRQLSTIVNVLVPHLHSPSQILICGNTPLLPFWMLDTASDHIHLFSPLPLTGHKFICSSSPFRYYNMRFVSTTKCCGTGPRAWVKKYFFYLTLAGDPLSEMPVKDLVVVVAVAVTFLCHFLPLSNPGSALNGLSHMQLWQQTHRLGC